MTAQTLYVYAIVPTGSPAPTGTGIDGAALHTVDAPQVSAVVHTHRSGPYEGADEDVKRWVLEHSDVIEDCWSHASSVLPVSFNVIARGSEDSGETAADQLGKWLTEAGDDLAKRLQDLAGTSELRVEITLDPAEFPQDDPTVVQLQADLQDKAPGVRRLLEKRLQKVQKQVTDSAADRLYPEYRARLAAQCLQLQDYASSHRPAGVVSVLSAACLVESAHISRLGAELTSIQEEAPTAQIRFLGPWPPYSFVDIDAGVTAEHQEGAA